MIKVENINVWGFEHAVRAARNPKDSWKRSDSGWVTEIDCSSPVFHVGPNDLDLLKRLYKGGTEHRTYARMVQVSMDIVAPLYWWKEADRYTVGKSQVSCSTMHMLTKNPITLADFSIDNYEMAGCYKDAFLNVIDDCENLRKAYLASCDKQYWRWLIQLLPESYNQRRTVCMSYETVFKMIHERENHRLSEWREFVEILKKLPCIKEIIDDAV